MDEQTLFYDQYKRSYSFLNTLAASGFPSESETKLLAKLVKGSDIQFNPNVLDVIFKPPLNTGKNGLRNNLKQAKRLLEEADGS